MSIYPESQLGIWLNTPIKYLETTAEQNLRAAHNDPIWCSAANDSDTFMGVARVDAIAGKVSDVITDPNNVGASSRASLHSDDELGQLFELPADSLFDFVKFSMVSHVVDEFYRRHRYNTQPGKLRVLDLGCGLHPAHRYLRRKIRNLSYIGVEHQIHQHPDALTDISHPRAVNKIRCLAPDVVLLLDVLSESHTSLDELQATLARLAIAASETSLILISFPHRKKLHPNTRFAGEDSVMLNSEQWLELIGEYFLIEGVTGIGYLSANLPASESAIHSTAKGINGVFNSTMRCALRYLCECDSIRRVDLMITRLLGRTKAFHPGSHSMLVSAKPRSVRSIRQVHRLH